MFKKTWKNLQIHTKLGIVVGLMGLLMIVQLLVLIFAMNLLSTTRILVSAESYWSKANKDARSTLIAYVSGNQKEDYQRFKELIQIPLGDKMARLEILKDKYDYKIAYNGFLQGNNHPEDIGPIINNLRRFKNYPPVQKVLFRWAEADEYMDKLILLAEEINQDLILRNYSHQEIYERIDQISNLKVKQRDVNSNFAGRLGELNRSIESVITWALLFAVITTVGICFIIMNTFKLTFGQAIENFRLGINQVKSGNFSDPLPVHSFDEFGDLTKEINEMFISLKEQTSGRQTAEESQARLAILADAMPIIVYIMSPEAKITFCNKRFWDYLGELPGDPSDISWDEIVHCEDIEACIKAYYEAIEHNNVCVTESRIRGKGGSYHWFLSRAEPIFDSEGALSHWYGTMMDITEQHHIREALESAVQMRDKFLSIASHELKTPLTTLLLQAQMKRRYLERGELMKFSPEKFMHMVEDKEEQVKRLINLVDDMLDVSRIQSGKLSMNKSRFKFNELLKKIVSRFELIAQASNIKISIEEEVECEVFWDKDRIQQVIENLFTNALRYGNNNSIKVSTGRSSDNLKISVKDYGIGISADDQSRIFELFETVNTSNRTSGLGLGLYIVKKIVLAHGGLVKVQSVLGEGSEFIIEIPIK